MSYKHLHLKTKQNKQTNSIQTTPFQKERKKQTNKNNKKERKKAITTHASRLAYCAD